MSSVGSRFRVAQRSRFPGQAAGDAKIPSVILYNDAGEVKAVGAEAEDYFMPDEDGEAEQGLIKVERYVNPFI